MCSSSPLSSMAIDSHFCSRPLPCGPGHDGWVRKVIASADGELVASCSVDKVKGGRERGRKGGREEGKKGGRSTDVCVLTDMRVVCMDGDREAGVEVLD